MVCDRSQIGVNKPIWYIPCMCTKAARDLVITILSTFSKTTKRLVTCNNFVAISIIFLHIHRMQILKIPFRLWKWYQSQLNQPLGISLVMARHRNKFPIHIYVPYLLFSDKMTLLYTFSLVPNVMPAWQPHCLQRRTEYNRLFWMALNSNLINIPQANTQPQMWVFSSNPRPHPQVAVTT
jgi:hypothetical protein